MEDLLTVIHRLETPTVDKADRFHTFLTKFRQSGIMEMKCQTFAELIGKEKKGVRTMADITFEITEEMGVLSESAKGWTKELNLVSWNGRPPKYDIREWSPNHEKMGKGMTFTEEEMAALQRLLNK